MLDIRVVSPTTLRWLFRSLPNDGLDDLAPLIVEMAMTAWVLDWKLLRKSMNAWTARTRFFPKPTTEPQAPGPWDCPVREYTTYHGRRFYRDRHCSGITLAIRCLLPRTNKLCHAIWTTGPSTANCKAYVFVRDSLVSKWKLRKILNRQRDPFITWWAHLGGKQLYADRQSPLPPRPESLFHDLTVPLFGWHRFLRSRLHMRSIDRDDIVWVLIRQVSDMLPSSLYDQHRLAWRSFH